MTSEMDWENTDEHWVEDSWQGQVDGFSRTNFKPVDHTDVSLAKVDSKSQNLTN